MPAQKYLKNNAGVLTEQAAAQTSAGAADGGKIVALDDQGRLDNSVMPVGIGADTAVIAASEALAAGDWVNVWNSSGAKVRKADGSSAGKECHGFVLAAVSNGANATVYFEGTNNQVTGQTPGAVFLGTTAGLGQASAPTAAGHVVQRLGVAISATAVSFEPQQPIVLA